MNLLTKALTAIALVGMTNAPLSAALPGAESLAKLIIAEFDTNSDDIIDSGEWEGGIAANFDKMDTNGDGSLQAKEVDGRAKDIAKEAGDFAAELMVALIKQVLLALDTNGDKLTSREEYSTLSTGLFTRMDADTNHSLVLAELSELPMKVISK